MARNTHFDPQWTQPWTEFRWATDTEAVELAARATRMRLFLNVEGWLNAYWDPQAEHAYFHDSTTGRWVVPMGKWGFIEPGLLAVDASTWIDEQ